MPEKYATSLESLRQLLAIMRRLRDPEQGCPWDLQQSFASIAPHTLEEVYEVVDAIELGDMKQLRDELGDLLFQIVFHAQLGSERGLFDFDSVASAICTKLLQRHPHVFPGGVLDAPPGASSLSASQVERNWEEIKQQERALKRSGEEASALDDVPLALGALLRAVKLQKRAAAQGFDWHDVTGVLAKVREELGELEGALAVVDRVALAEEFGDLLFTLVNLARHLDLNPESALRQANRKFEARFRRMEQVARAAGTELRLLSDDELDKYWARVKAELKDSSA